MTTQISNIVALPFIQGQIGIAWAINNSGQVVGVADDPTVSLTTNAILWQNGTATALATFPNYSLAYAESINNKGQVVGYATPGLSSGPNQHALLWQNGTVTDLGTLGSLATDNSLATAINDLGQVVGQSVNSAGNGDAFLWQNGVMTDLGTLPGGSGKSIFTSHSYATGINNESQVVGSSLTTGNVSHAFLWQNGTMTDLGVPTGATSSHAHAINDSGLVVGDALSAQSHFHAVQWLSGTATDLGLLAGFTDSSADAVNNAGIIVGEAFNVDATTGDITTQRAVIWQNGVIADLNSLLPANSGWVLNSTVGINSQGQIVGDGSFNGSQTEFVVTLGSTPLVGQTVQNALQSYAAGHLTNVSPVAVTDSAANIQANLDKLEAPAAAGDIAYINFSDSGTPTLTLTDAQFIYNDTNAIGHLTGNYAIAITHGSAYEGSLGEFYNDSNVTSVAVVDTATQVSSGLDEMQVLVTAGRTVTVTLTDGGIPNLTITAVQLSGDAGALGDITGYFTVTATAPAASATIAGLAGHGTTVKFSGAASQYSVAPAGDGVSLTVTYNGTGTGAGSVDHLSNIAALQFSDHSEIVARTPGSSTVTTGNITELYGAVFGRTPDVAGLAYYQSELQANPNIPLTTFAQWFLASPEYTGNSAHAYAQTTTGDTQFIDDSYTNLLHRAPEATAVPYYLGLISQLTQGQVQGTAGYTAALAFAHAVLLTDFSASAEFLGNVQVTAQHPADAQHWLVLI